MCNFIWSVKQTYESLARQMEFEFNLGEEALGDKNPTDTICVLLPGGFEMVRWGLIPHWSKEVPRVLMTQARSETLDEKPSFRGLLAMNRCLIPVQGFYEWYSKVKTGISREDGEPMYLAGLWDEWQGQKSATIITTDSNDFVMEYQDRMPLILEADEIKIWLLGSEAEARALIMQRDPKLKGESVEGQGNLFD